MRAAARFYLFAAAVLLGATLSLALGVAAGQVFSNCPADRCVRLDRQSGQ